MEGNRAGAQTKELIVNTAKRLFYDVGFNDVSLSQICNEAGITRTKYFYYFKNKEELADLISNDVIRYCENTMGSSILKKYYKDPTTGAGVATYLYFRAIMADENLLRFYTEVLQSNSASLIGNNSYRSMLMMLALKSKLPKSQFDIYYIATTSLPGPILYAYGNGLLKDKDVILDYLLKSAIYPLYPYKTEDILKKIHEEIEEFDSSNQFSLDLKGAFLGEYKAGLLDIIL